MLIRIHFTELISILFSRQRPFRHTFWLLGKVFGCLSRYRMEVAQNTKSNKGTCEMVNAILSSAINYQFEFKRLRSTLEHT